MIDESMGKIIGMAMAYGVSSLGLLLAYYNYRKRIMKAEKVFTPRAYGVFAAIIVVVAGAVLVIRQLSDAPVEKGADAYAEEMVEMPDEDSTMYIEGRKPLEEQEKKSLVLGIVIPLAIFAFSFWVTFMLYRHFTKKIEEGDAGPEPPST